MPKHYDTVNLNYMTKDWGQVCFSEIATESADAVDKQVPLTSSNVVDEFYLTDHVTGMFITDMNSLLNGCLQFIHRYIKHLTYVPLTEG